MKTWHLSHVVDAEGEVLDLEESEVEEDVLLAGGGDDDGDLLHDGDAVPVQAQRPLHVQEPGMITSDITSHMGWDLTLNDLRAIHKLRPHNFWY